MSTQLRCVIGYGLDPQAVPAVDRFALVPFPNAIQYFNFPLHFTIHCGLTKPASTVAAENADWLLSLYNAKSVPLPGKQNTVSLCTPATGFQTFVLFVL